jgi:hypothetical protein
VKWQYGLNEVTFLEYKNLRGTLLRIRERLEITKHLDTRNVEVFWVAGPVSGSTLPVPDNASFCIMLQLPRPWLQYVCMDEVISLCVEGNIESVALMIGRKQQDNSHCGTNF